MVLWLLIFSVQFEVVKRGGGANSSQPVCSAEKRCLGNKECVCSFVVRRQGWASPATTEHKRQIN